MALAVQSVVEVDQFYGIEVGEFPARIAATALWMMDHILNDRLSRESGHLRANPIEKSPISAMLRAGDRLVRRAATKTSARTSSAIRRSAGPSASCHSSGVSRRRGTEHIESGGRHTSGPSRHNLRVDGLEFTARIVDASKLTN